ncbi:MAG: radical SAM protein, partial [Deltaproteobacteria bacterium]|nr:radical SAM protein [Deltaproteobacteria bacterium]
FGGDALLRKDLIFNVIKFCKKNGIETFFPTNSLLMDRDAAKELVDSGLDVIYISLDDIGSRHDEIRGKDGTFKLVRNAIENIARERGGGKTPRIIICTTISNLNYKHFADIAEFLEDYPVDTIYPRVLGEFDKEFINNSAVKGIRPEPYFTSSDRTSHLLKEAEAREFRDAVKKMKLSRKGKRIYINFRAIDEAGDQALTKGIHALKKCLLCSTFVTVDPYGNVIPCPMYNRYIIGNLLKDGLEDIWGNDKHQFFIKEQKRKKIEICKNCIMRIYYPNLPETCAYLLKRTKEKALNLFAG